MRPTPKRVTGFGLQQESETVLNPSPSAIQNAGARSDATDLYGKGALLRPR